MILLLLAACTDKDADTGPPALPACATPANLAFEVQTEEEERVTEADVSWSSPDGASFDAATETGCDTPPCLGFTGPGRVEFTTLLNRGVPYHLAGTLGGSGAVTLTVDQVLREGGRSPILETTLKPGAVSVDFVVDTAGVSTLVGLEAAGAEAVTFDGLRLTGSQWALVDGEQPTPLALGFLIHIEESGAFQSDAANWSAHAAVIAGLSELLARHGARLTVQPDLSFVDGAVAFDPTWLSARAAEGVSWSAHLHDESEGTEAFERAARQAIRGFFDAGLVVDDLNGGFGLGPWSTLDSIGYRSLSAFKNPDTQLGLAQGFTTPWRPPDGSTAADEAGFTTHDPDGPLVFLPGMGTREVDTSRFVSYATRVLSQVRVHTRPGFVNTWYFIDHIDAYGPPGDAAELQAWIDAGGLEEALAPYDTFLGEVTDPLVASGDLTYSTPTDMAFDFLDWERACTW